MYSAPSDQFGVKPYCEAKPGAAERVLDAVAKFTLFHAAPSIVVGDCPTALDVKQSVISGITDAASEQANSINLRTNGPGTNWAVECLVQIGPVVLSFETEHPSTSLHIIANLAKVQKGRQWHGPIKCGCHSRRTRPLVAVELIPSHRCTRSKPTGAWGNMGTGAALTAMSAATAGAAMPSAMRPTVPSKNFFIYFSGRIRCI